MSDDNSAGRYGTLAPSDQTSEYNRMLFTVTQILNGRNHVALVKVIAVSNDGDVAPVGSVDVQPMVNQLDGQGASIPHGVINSLPYMRMQGGTNAIILDPQVGDIGLAVFADRDISSVKATLDLANPGSMRRADMADGLYFGGFLNGTPEQFLRFSSEGVEIKSAGSVKVIAASSVMLDTPVVDVSDTLTIGNGATGSFTTPTGQVVTVSDGIITNIF